jgi:hypothetical protein
MIADRPWPLRAGERPGVGTDQCEIESMGPDAEHLEWAEHVEELEPFEEDHTDSHGISRHDQC